jgi:Bacterial Ig domain/Concanavalin A-like lectin/glucanases superfamily
VASQFDFTGFATHYGLNGFSSGDNIRHSLTTSWSGRAFARHNRTTSGTTTGATFKNWTQLGTVTDGQFGGYKVRIVFRLPTVAPNVARSLWDAMGGSSTYMLGGVRINTDLTLQCYTNIANGGPATAGTASVGTIPLGIGENEGWVTVDITYTVTASGANDVIAVSAAILWPDQTTETISHSSGTTSLGTPNLQAVTLFGLPSSAGFTGNWIGAIDFGLWWQVGATNADFASMPAFPPTNVRARELRVTAQGSNNGIAYSSGASFLDMRKPWLYANTNAGDRLTTSTAGQQSDFTHEGVAQFNPTSTYGLRLIQVAQATGTPTAQFMVGGVNIAGVGALGATTHPKYVDLTTRSVATLDALQVGVQSAVTAGTYDCPKFFIEVLHDGDKYTSTDLNPGDGYQQEWLTWTGDGSSPRTLSGLSFRPSAMLVFAPGQAAIGPQLCTQVMGDHAFQAQGGAGGGGSFYGFTSDGAVVDGNLNTNTQLYYALCLRDDGTNVYDVSGPTPVVSDVEFRFQVGGLTSIASDVIDFGEARPMTPGLVLVQPGNNHTGGVSVLKIAAMGTDAARLNSASNSHANLINSIEANGFTAGTGLGAVLVNADPAVYIAWSDAEADLYSLLQWREVAATLMSGTATTDYDYRVTFESDADASITRAIIGTVTHPAPGSSVTFVAASHATAAGSNRGLLVVAVTYGTTGTLSATYGAVSLPLVYLKVQSFRKCAVFYLADPTVGTDTITVTNTTSMTSLTWSAYAITNTYGLRFINSTSALAILNSQVPARLKDIVISHMATDPLDSGLTLTTPGGWTELFNDGSISNACVSSWANGIADTGMAPLYTETGSTDVYEHTVLALMPAALPAWGPYGIVCKGNYTNAQAAGVRLDLAYYSGATCTSYASNSVAVASAITAMDDYVATMPKQSSLGLFRGSEGWYFVLGPSGEIIALSPPSSANDAYSGPQDTLLTVDVGTGVLVNDDTNGGGTMTAVLETDVVQGTLTLASDGSFTYMPPGGFVGSVFFTYRATNDGGPGTLATVTITITLVDVAEYEVNSLVEWGLGGSYRTWLRSRYNDDTSVLMRHWFLGDTYGLNAQEDIVGQDGTYSGATTKVLGLLPEYGPAEWFPGSGEPGHYVTISGFGLPDADFFITAMFRPYVSGLGGVQCLVRTGPEASTAGYLGIDATAHPRFGPIGGPYVTATDALEAGERYHLVGTYGSGFMRLWQNGNLVAGPTTGTIAGHGDGRIGGFGSEDAWGAIQGVAIGAETLEAEEVSELWDTAEWDDITPDLRDSVPLVVQRGIHSDSPTDKLARTGTMTFALNNSQYNSAGLLGYYSPGHVNQRSGFDRGAFVRYGLTWSGVFYPWFTGRIKSIKPSSGIYDERITHCIATDWMEEAGKSQVRGLGIGMQQSITYDEGLALLIDSMRNRPHGVEFMAGGETYEIAFDAANQPMSTAQVELRKFADSEVGRIYITGDGTLVCENRGARSQSQDPLYEFIDTYVEAEPERSTDQIVNLVKVTVHPRRVDDDPTTVLYALDNPLQIDNGVEVNTQLQFRDPSQLAAKVGGLDIVTPVATTHYLINTMANGSGTDVTANPNISITWVPEANGMTLQVLNSYGNQVYFTFLEIIGRGVYDFQPITFEASNEDSIEEDGVREVAFDMPYQSSGPVGEAASQLYLNAYALTPTRIRTIDFKLNDTEATREAGLNGEIGDRVLIADTMSAVNAEFNIAGLKLDVGRANDITVTWWLEPADTNDYWTFDVSAFDISTRFGV